MDYGEILCQAINLISENVMGQIKSDKTVTCTIIKDSLKSKGEYTVSEGSVSYTAYSTSTEYKKDDVVYVQIPEGNYDEQKFIIGKKLKSNELVYNFVSPLKDFVKIETFKIEGEKSSLIANDTEETVKIGSITGNFKGYSHIGLSADFSSWLGNSVREGNYGLIIQLKNQDQIIENIVFDSQDMNGAIYSFKEPSSQEMLLDISSYDLITSVEIYYYQLNNFIDNKGNKIIKSSASNLHVSNIILSFGMTTKELKTENLFLFTNDSISYNGEEKEIILRWVRYNKNKELTMFTAGSDTTEFSQDYKIVWYKYNTALQKKDIYAGEKWEEISNKGLPLQLIVTPDVETKTEEKYKVILFIYNKGNVDTYYESNILTFINQNEIVNQTTLNAVYGLTLKPEDELGGQYYIYDMSNSLFNINNASQERKLQCYYREKSDNSETRKLNQADLIYWYVPRTNSMLQFESYFDYPCYTNAQLKELNFKENDKYGLIGKDNIVREYYQIEADGNAIRILPDIQYGIDVKQTTEAQYAITPLKDELTYLSYRIKSQYKKQFSNNTVACKIKINKITYQNDFIFAFGNGGNNGSEASLVLQLLKGKKQIDGVDYVFTDAINMQGKKSSNKKYIGVEAQIFDTKGQQLSMDQLKEEYEFKFSFYNPYNNNAISNLKLKLQKKNIVIYEIINEPAIENIDIIQCKLSNYQPYNLINYIGIPIKFNDTYYDKIAGPDSIVIDTSGQATFDEINYVLMDKDGKEVYPENLKWRIVSEPKIITDKASFESFIPTIEEPQERYQIIDPNNIEQVFDKDSKYIIEFKDIDKAYELQVEPQEGQNNPPKVTIADKGQQVEYTSVLYILGTEKNKLQNYLKQHNDKEDPFVILSMKRELKPSELKWKLKVHNLILDNCPKLAVQAYKSGQFEEDEQNLIEELVYFQTPLIILHNTWISKIINEWDGKTLGINESEGYLLGKMLAAGKKNEDNEFSGVILGDWSNTDTQAALTKNTGLYGFHDGIMSFYFKDDGTAAIGKKGIGQIQFNGNKGIIQSGIYELSGGKDGALIDFTTGKIELRNSTNGNIELNASDATIYETEVLDEEKGLVGIVNSDEKNTHLIYQDNKWQVIKYEQDKNTGKYTGNYSIQEGKVGSPNYKSGFPIKAGENFKIAWDGSVFANNGKFTGTIHATGGTITGNMQVKGILKGATIESGNFNAQFTANGIWQDYYDLVTDAVSESYDTKIMKDGKDKGYKYWRYDNGEYIELKSEEDKEKAYKDKVLYEKIFYWVPGINENNQTTNNYFPITFDMIDSEGEITNDLVQIGMVRVFDGTKSNIFGIRTQASGGNIQTNIGFDSGDTLRAHGKNYSGLSASGNFNEPIGQICLDFQNKEQSWFHTYGIQKASIDAYSHNFLKIVAQSNNNSPEGYIGIQKVEENIEVKIKADKIILEQENGNINLIDKIKSIENIINEISASLKPDGEEGGN